VYGFAGLPSLRPPTNLNRWASLGILLLVGLCLLPVLLYLPFLNVPFERDEGVYATIAQGLLDGKVPYRDLFDNKPPLVYGWYAFSFLLFGESVVAPRIVASILLSATTLALFTQVRMVLPRGAAYAAAGIFALSTGLPWVALHANTEAYMLLPLVASLTAFTVGIRGAGRGWFLLAGALGALAMLTKQVAVWNLLALAIVAWGWRWRSTGAALRGLTPAIWLAAGVAAIVAIVAVPFALAGALDDLVYANVSYNWLYFGSLTYGQRALNFVVGVFLFIGVAAPLIAAAAFGLVAVLRGRKRAAQYLLILWAIASAVGVASGGRFFPHYFLQLLPAMAILAAVAIHDRIRDRDFSLPHRPVLVIGIALVAISLVTNGVLYFAPRRAEHRVAETVFYQKEWESQSQAVGAYIAERTGPEDTIFNFGREAQIYFYADRSPAVSYFYDWAYFYDERTVSVTVEALREARPVYVIDSVQPPLFEPYQRPAEVERLLAEDYEYVGRLYFADLYRLKSRG
jgi:4-amino-4-deoxy-L-arabinose transferase-like glycosyltransferase